MRRVIVQNEKFLPLKNMEVEMYNLETGKVLGTVKTDAKGIASFPEQATGTYHFRPLTGRGAGNSGTKGNYGSVHFQEIPII